MKSTIIRSEVAEVSFGFYSDEEIRNVSCCQVCSPIAFDALGNPLSSGLYDPKLGPTSQHSLPCPTCGLLYINCPGHPGHIELAVPVYHPLMFANMFQLLRAQCANCHKFRIPSSKVRITLIKLKLLEIGLVKESEEVEDLLNPPVIFNDSTACDAADATVDIESQLSRYEELYTTHIQKFPESRPDSFLKRLQREVIDSFIKAALVCKKCDSCGSFSPPLRKDGHAKLFEKPLAKRIRKSMQGMKIKLKPALETLARDDHMAADISDDSDDDMVLNADDSEEEGEARYSEKDKYLAPFEVEARMKLLWKSHHEYLDFVWGRVSLRAAAIFKKSVLPEHSTLWRIFFMKTVLVPPSRFRPPSDLGDMQAEHPQNIHLSKVLTINERIMKAISLDKTASEMSVESDVTPQIENMLHISKLVTDWIDLQNAVNCFMDSSKDPNQRAGEDSNIGIRQVLEKKEGLFRRHMMGKRVNYCCRSVISPDPFLGMNEIGIPVQFAKELHYPTPVTSWNIKMLRQMVENGPNVYPGANQIETGDGKIVKLDRFSSQERSAKAKLLMSGPGVKVYRHLINGDVLLVNRQPTLHKPGIMAHKARVLQHVKEQTLRMNYANCNAYNADFDGDEMNCHFVQNEIARAEATSICNTDNQYIVPTSGNPLRGLIQDHVASGVKLTCKETFLNKEQFQQLLYIAVTGLPGTEVVSSVEEMMMPIPSVLKPVQLWTGKQVVTALLRHLCRPPLPALHLDGKTRTPPTAFGHSEREHVVVFRFGELLCGVLDKSSMGNASLGIVHAIYELYGSELAGLILNAFGRLFTFHLQSAGHTCGIEDLTLTKSADMERARLLNKVQIDAAIGLREYLESGDSNTTRKRSDQPVSASDIADFEKKVSVLLQADKQGGKVKLDGAFQAVVNKSASDVLKACLPTGLQIQFPKNNFSMMVLTGAKGSAVNQSQISCFLGQQALEGQRVPMMISGKTLPSFRPYDCRARAGGFITDRFLTGVRPQEYYFHCMAGREGLVDTAVKTSRSGYLQRCLVKHLEELRVQYDMTVRDSAGNVVQFLYGEDGLDPTSAALLGGKDNQLQFLSRNHQALVYKYSVHGNYFEQGLEMDSAKAYQLRMDNARSVVDQCTDIPLGKWKFNKKSIIMARKKLDDSKPWSRYNMHKKWFIAEIIKVRKSSSSQPNLPLSYDVRYVDGTIQKHVPARMRIRNANFRSDGSERNVSKDALIPLIKPGLPDPVMSALRVQNCVGAISEGMQQKIRNYILSNPDNVVSEMTTETSVTAEALELLVWIKYMRSLACPGEAVGCVAAQSVGEPSTQMTLNTFHLAGHGGANVTLGIPRLREIIMTASRALKTPTMLIPLAQGQGMDTARVLALQFSRVPVSLLLHHNGGIEVGERIARNPATFMWERIYRLRFHFEDPSKILQSFGITFSMLADSIKTTVIQKLHHIVQLEMRRMKAQAQHSVAVSNVAKERVNNAVSENASGTENYRDDDTLQKKQSAGKIGIESDDEDKDDIDDVYDEEQGTLKLGGKEELTGYDDDSDTDVMESQMHGGLVSNMAIEGSDEYSDSDSERTTSSLRQKATAVLASAAQRDSSSRRSGKLYERVGNGRIVSRGDTVKSMESEGWIELEIAFPAHARKLLMVQLAEQACQRSSVRETKDISNAYAVECDVDGEKRFAIQTEGVNFEAAWRLPQSLADCSNLKCNDIWRVLCTYGVEAARQSIVSEIKGVFGVYGIDVNPRHLSVIADFMTRTGSYIPMNRMGMSECPSQFLQMSFETTCTFLTQAAQEGAVEKLESPSASIVTGSVPQIGTGCFDVMLPL